MINYIYTMYGIYKDIKYNIQVIVISCQLTDNIISIFKKVYVSEDKIYKILNKTDTNTNTIEMVNIGKVILHQNPQ